jgi:hypothetical protein
MASTVALPLAQNKRQVGRAITALVEQVEQVTRMAATVMSTATASALVEVAGVMQA